MAGAVSSVSSETMTALAALRARFTLLCSTHRDSRQGWYYGGGTCGFLPLYVLPGHLASPEDDQRWYSAWSPTSVLRSAREWSWWWLPSPVAPRGSHGAAWGGRFRPRLWAATCASWLCYYRALQDGTASVVMPFDRLNLLVTVFFAALVMWKAITRRYLVRLTMFVDGTLTMLT